MENEIKDKEIIKDLTNAFEKALTPICEGIQNLAQTLMEIFKDTWEDIKRTIPDFEEIRFSRKRFVKLLMSIGYQRNEANKIAWNYHKQKGKYTLLDFIKESNNKEEK